jgi:hypothetical protein
MKSLRVRPGMLLQFSFSPAPCERIIPKADFGIPSSKVLHLRLIMAGHLSTTFAIGEKYRSLLTNFQVPLTTYNSSVIEICSQELSKNVDYKHPPLYNVSRNVNQNLRYMALGWGYRMERQEKATVNSRLLKKRRSTEILNFRFRTETKSSNIAKQSSRE